LVNPPCVMGLNKEQGATDLLRIHGRFARFSQNSPHSQGPLITNQHTCTVLNDGDFFHLNRGKRMHGNGLTKGAGLSSGDAGSAGSGANNTCIRLETYRLGRAG
jgi:hypothetical protein